MKQINMEIDWLDKCLLGEESKHVLTALVQRNYRSLELVTSDLVDIELLDEIKTIVSENVSIYFGKTLRDIKLVLRDDQMLREHKIFVKYVGPRKLIITSVELPQHTFQNIEYNCIDEVIQVFSKNMYDLSKYFHELELIDQSCTIMEPINPSFKYDYRKIFLDDRTWLHLEVTPEGLATNIHLIGQSDYWTNKLQSGLLSWDHDKEIVENILTVFDLADFPQPTKASRPSNLEEETKFVADTPVCAICLCEELPDVPGLPQPLCQNSMCGVNFHRICLYQWLVACAGSRPPAFGVASGACPTCLQPISCSEKDN